MATYPTAAPGTTLTAIQTKVRRLTRTPSEAQLTTDDLNNYINTFVVYDFPAHLRTFQLRRPFSFVCNPYQDTYFTDKASFGSDNPIPPVDGPLNSLYDFQNLYLEIHKPIFVAGYETFFTQDRTEFYNTYPINNYIQNIGTLGDGVTTQFTGTIQFGGTINSTIPNRDLSILKRNVLFDSVDVNYNGISLVDVPVIDATTGIETIWGNLYVPGQQPTTPVVPPQGNPIQPPTASIPYFNNGVDQDNYINYATGKYVITFPVAPGVGKCINSQTVPTIQSRPFGMLYYDNTITLRPVPDQPYVINFEVEARPTQLFNQNSNPQLNELWQYIAYGAALKIFQDKMDMDSVAMIMPELQKQEDMCLRRTLVQLGSNQRTSTIYAGTMGDNAGNFNNGFGYGGSF